MSTVGLLIFLDFLEFESFETWKKFKKTENATTQNGRKFEMVFSTVNNENEHLLNENVINKRLNTYNKNVGKVNFLDNWPPCLLVSSILPSLFIFTESIRRALWGGTDQNKWYKY